MIFSEVLVHVVAELNILGKYNLLFVYLLVQSLSQRQTNMTLTLTEMASLVHVVCESLNWVITAFLEATSIGGGGGERGGPSDFN